MAQEFAERDKYQSPFSERYASREMQYIFSDEMKFSTWRKLWIALAESQKELGLKITDAQIEEMSPHVMDIDYEMALRFEAKTRHDVMAHIHTYGEQCPAAASIIHLGATSCYVGDNTDLIVQRRALNLVRKLLLNVVQQLSDFAAEYKALPCLAYTHFQAAQPTTLGKRATLWMQDLMLDLAQLDFVLENLRFAGCKGTTGTGASFLALFDNDHEKVGLLEGKIARKMGFEQIYAVSGQTYSRKVDYYVLSVLSGIAQSASKFANDIRLLAHEREVEEPFEKNQVGSSAMAYKRNPMRSERICALSRHVIANTLNPALTASTQWLERTLDDSANRRLAIPEAFLAVDGILSLMLNITDGLVVYPSMIAKHLNAELPFMATENILMHAVQKGGDRQKLHERIRQHSMTAAKGIKEYGEENNLLELLARDPEFDMTRAEMEQLLRAENFVGRAKEQTEEFLAEVKAVLADNEALLGMQAEVRV